MHKNTEEKERKQKKKRKEETIVDQNAKKTTSLSTVTLAQRPSVNVILRLKYSVSTFVFA